MRSISGQRLVRASLTGAVLSAASASAAFAATTATWSWRASGTLGRIAVCSQAGVRTATDVCRYKIPNAPTASGTVTEVVRVKNTSAHRACYGLSISTSYMAGLQSFCVKANSTGQYRASGLARHYFGASLSIFVTSGSKTRPISAIGGSHPSPFTITFSEPRS